MCLVSFHIQTLQEAAKVPMRKKQPCEPSAEKNSSLLHSQSSHHFITHHHHCAVDIELLESQLTRENYRAKFHQLLCREEEEHERLLAERLAILHEYLVCQYVTQNIYKSKNFFTSSRPYC